ncbi:MAG: DoxX family protein [Acidobacteriota bacterium]|nr:DoxX family protein [Acidobacteriota bacterium]
MSQTTMGGTAATSAGSTGKVLNVVWWILQVALAAMFLMAGFSKLSGNPQMVGMFESIGVGQWFRYVTGGVEVIAALLLLIPRLCGFGALLVIGTMIGAVATHLFVVGGSPVVPLVLLVVAGLIAWARRVRTMNLLSGRR